MSSYTVEERVLTTCITRRRDCEIGDCKTCVWMTLENKELLRQQIAEEYAKESK